MTHGNILIMGCTASGKSRLAFELARRLGGEILSVDSMKVYRGMDLGTAKPSLPQRQEIRHHLIDVVDPGEAFSVGRFVELADAAIADIGAQKKRVIAVGGTGMYIRGLLEGVFDGPPAQPDIRKRLNAQAKKEGGLEELHERLRQIDPVSAERIHRHDLKRIVRALEVYELTGKPISSFQQQSRTGRYRHNWRLIELHRDKGDNQGRINARVKAMIAAGLVDEVASLLDRGISGSAAQAVGYAEIITHLQGEIKLDEAIEKIKINTRRLAKSQRTWFRSFPDTTVVEVGPTDTVEDVADRVTVLA